MDTAHDLGSELERTADDAAIADDVADTRVDDQMFDLGGDERRMHVRAYNHWVSLLNGRPFPSIADLEPQNIVDFGAHSVLIDFAGDIDDPRIAFLGKALREECDLPGEISRIADVPSRSLLSRLTDHYLQIIANRAPIGFEAEFVGTRGKTTLYRGILMPFATPGDDTIDYIYGVINWKEVADPVVQATLDLELHAAVQAAVAPHSEDTPVWADGPSGDHDPLAAALPGATLADTLSLARETAAAASAHDTRSRSALYRALGRAHDFGLAAETDADAYAELLADAGIAVQARAPMTPVVKLVFGSDYDKTRLTEYAAVLGHARRFGVAMGRLSAFLEGFEGGIKAVVAAERAAKRPAPSTRAAAVPLAERPALARVALPVEAAAGEAVVLVARMGRDGVLDIVHGHSDAMLAERLLAAKSTRRKRPAAAQPAYNA